MLFKGIPVFFCPLHDKKFPPEPVCSRKSSDISSRSIFGGAEKFLLTNFSPSHKWDKQDNGKYIAEILLNLLPHLQWRGKGCAWRTIQSPCRAAGSLALKAWCHPQQVVLIGYAAIPMIANRYYLPVRRRALFLNGRPLSMASARCLW